MSLEMSFAPLTVGSWRGWSQRRQVWLGSSSWEGCSKRSCGPCVRFMRGVTLLCPHLQYLIPMLGMLLGNACSGVAVGLSTILDELSAGARPFLAGCW